MYIIQTGCVHKIFFQHISSDEMLGISDGISKSPGDVPPLAAHPFLRLPCQRTAHVKLAHFLRYSLWCGHYGFFFNARRWFSAFCFSRAVENAQFHHTAQQLHCSARVSCSHLDVQNHHAASILLVPVQILGAREKT